MYDPSLDAKTTSVFANRKSENPVTSGTPIASPAFIIASFASICSSS